MPVSEKPDPAEPALDITAVREMATRFNGQCYASFAALLADVQRRSPLDTGRAAVREALRGWTYATHPSNGSLIFHTERLTRGRVFSISGNSVVGAEPVLLPLAVDGKTFSLAVHCWVPCTVYDELRAPDGATWTVHHYGVRLLPFVFDPRRAQLRPLHELDPTLPIDP